MSKKLTNGVVSGIGKISKDAINKLQKKEIDDDDIQNDEDDYWHQPITALKIKKKLQYKLAGHVITMKANKVKLFYEIPDEFIISY